jgi:hypothetical protein
MFRAAAIVCVASLSTAFAAQAQRQPVSPDAFPELKPRAILIAIIKGINASVDGTVPNPKSMSDMILCPPTRIKYSSADGRPEKWYVSFSMNSRTSAGGYSGRIMYGAVFRRDRLPEISRVQIMSADAFDQLINKAIERQMKDCPLVPNDQLAALTGSTDRPIVDVSH